jgi:hypothetical protein
MQVSVSPELLTLLSVDETTEQQEVLSQLWHETHQQVKPKKERLLEKQREVAVRKRARFAFD